MYVDEYLSHKFLYYCTIVNRKHQKRCGVMNTFAAKQSQFSAESYQLGFDIKLRPKLTKASKILRFKLLCIQKLIEDTLPC